MNRTDQKAWRAARRARAMQDAAAQAMWSGGVRRMPDRKKEAARRACRGKVGW